MKKERKKERKKRMNNTIMKALSPISGLAVVLKGLNWLRLGKN